MSPQLAYVRRFSAQFQNHSFTALLTAILGLFSLIGAAAIASYVYYSIGQERSSLLANLSAQADFTAASSQALFDDIGNSLEIATLQMVDGANIETQRPLLRQVLTQHPEISIISIFDAAGNRLLSDFTEQSMGSSSRGTPDPVHLPALVPQYRHNLHQLFADLGNSTRYTIGRVEYGTITRQWRIAFRYVKRDPSGQPRLIVHASIPVVRQAAIWDHLELPPDTRLGLYRDDGFPQVLWPHPSAHVDEFYSNPAATIDESAAAVIAEKGVRGSYEGFNSIIGTKQLGAYTRLPHLPLTAFVSVPTTRIYRNWWKHNYAFVIGSICGFAIFLGLSIVLLRREKTFNSALRSKADTDDLTGLPNRRFAEEYLDQKLEKGNQHPSIRAVMFIDLDSFKSINDVFGHHHGDAVLKALAGRLRVQLRESDLLARLGGDEFIAVLNCDGQKEAEATAARLISALKEPLVADGHRLMVTVSIGVSLFPDHGTSASELLKRADVALYSVKNSTRDGYAVFTTEMLQQVVEEMALKQELQKALQADDFVLHFQPKFDRRGAVVGCEALVRWMHPEHGLIRPSEFIPLAEKTGLILPLGGKVLRMACLQIANWRHAGIVGIPIAVNVSGTQLAQPDFVDIVKEIVHEADIPPTLLELEITESVLANDIESARGKMHALVAFGIKIALDDFGTGFSSLSYVKQFPFASLKIDRSFVADIAGKDDEAAIVDAIIAMSHALGVEVVAEGVETEAQWRYLRSRGCDAFQGYYLARPANSEVMVSFLSKLSDGASKMFPAGAGSEAA